VSNSNQKHPENIRKKDASLQTLNEYLVSLSNGSSIILNPESISKGFEKYQANLEKDYHGERILTFHAEILEALGIQASDFICSQGLVTGVLVHARKDENFINQFHELLRIDSLRSLKLICKENAKIVQNIDKFTTLIALDLSYNEFDSIPAQIGNLTSLIYLDLQGNKIEYLPKEFGNLINLSVYNQNEIKGLKDLESQERHAVLELLLDGGQVIIEMGHVIALDLSAREKNKISDQIGHLFHLRSLDLQGNHLNSIPQSIKNLKNLEHINISKNKFTQINDFLRELPSLRTFDLSYNQLTTIPDWIGTLPSLLIINLQGNQLTTLPEKIGISQTLNTIYIFGNQLKNLPESIGNIQTLQCLDVRNNLNLILPQAIAQCINLKIFNDTDIEEFSTLEASERYILLESLHTGGKVQIDGRHIVELDFSNLSLQSAPPSLNQLHFLKKLDLSKNKLTQLPTQYGELVTLTQFNKTVLNAFDTIPPEIRHALLETLMNCGQSFGAEVFIEDGYVMELDLSYQSLNFIPDAISKFKNLKSINLAHNQIELIPFWFNSFIKDKWIDISENPINLKEK
jgi:Leucine-rich repeat (LRR) protein